ncbi:MAG: class I SAM-dependent methyltransferase [Gammaproteobacteria bacterium]|nr:class I SAM-dependent methyltransferase [Gammaproteobacteria bacterium]
MPSYQSLEKKLGFDKALPVTQHWSAAPGFLDIISDYCLENKPRIIVECSSGTSSLILSQCCQLSQIGHIYSLENGEEYVKKTSRQLDDFLLSEYCDVIHSPLQDVRLGEEKYQWYAADDLPDVEIDMLVIDGPPGFLQKHSRYPALPILKNRMAQHCAVFLDDAARDDEQELVKCWLNENPDFQAEYIENERGCFILKK